MTWPHSLYSRIAIGLAAFLAAMLAVQAVLFLWMMTQSDRAMPGQSPTGYAQAIALDLGNALVTDPEIDVEHYVREEYPESAYPFFVMLANGSAISVGPPPGEAMFLAARTVLQTRPPAPQPEGRDRRGRVSRGEPPPDDGGNAPTGGFRPALILVNHRVVGVVVAPRRAPWSFLIARFAPTLSLVAGAVMIVGMVITSALVFGPPRRRLQRLEAAAQRLGAGDLSARAPTGGGDEIAAVAMAFNRMADDLEARAQALAASDRARRQLLADVSHELNTPITAMHGYLETLKMPEMALDEETRTRYLTVVGDEMARLERIIGDLLDLARLESGGGRLNIEKVPVAQLFERIRARHEHACETTGVSIVETIEPGSETLRADPDRLEQALQNLAANAIRYAPSGSTLRLTSAVQNGAIAIRVEDEGAGIPAEHLPHIFDRFYKVDSSRHKAAGSGLGLSIVKAIVERHGARISVSSEPGRTTFEIAGLQSGQDASPRPAGRGPARGRGAVGPRDGSAGAGESSSPGRI